MIPAGERTDRRTDRQRGARPNPRGARVPTTAAAVSISADTAFTIDDRVDDLDALVAVRRDAGVPVPGTTAAGAELCDVVRTRIHVTDIDRWREVGRAHREAFGEARPATSRVEVAGLVDPGMLVEIEAEACVGA